MRGETPNRKRMHDDLGELARLARTRAPVAAVAISTSHPTKASGDSLMNAIRASVHSQR